MRFLILAHPGDGLAIGVAAHLLRRHPPHETMLVAVDEIVYAPGWSHAIDGAGSRSIVTLHDGRTIRDDDVGVVFNRLRQAGISGFSAADREYAAMEMFALLVSWLAALRCPVINPVSPRGLGGERYTPLAWGVMAGRAGLPVPGLCIASSPLRYAEAGGMAWPDVPAIEGVPGIWMERQTGGPLVSAYVVGERVLGDIPAGLVEPCLRLSRSSGIRILRIDFTAAMAPDEWIFRGVDQFPRASDARLADAVVHHLEESS